jgi:hypothetical protein
MKFNIKPTIVIFSKLEHMRIEVKNNIPGPLPLVQRGYQVVSELGAPVGPTAVTAGLHHVGS